LGKVFDIDLVITFARRVDQGQQQMLVWAIMQIIWTHFPGWQLYNLRNEPINLIKIKSSDRVLFV
jgi:hypothetical protein